MSLFNLAVGMTLGEKCEFYLQNQNTILYLNKEYESRNIIVIYSFLYWKEEAIIRFVNSLSNIF